MIGGLIGSVSAAPVIIVAIVLYAIGETESFAEFEYERSESCCATFSHELSPTG